MRIRSIKPEFWRSEDISNLPLSARLTFIGLWSYVDDNGVGEYRVSSIAADLFADDLARDPQETLKRVSGDTQTLENTGLITVYQAGRKQLCYITNWEAHQIVNRPSKGHQYPLPPADLVESQRNCMRHSGDTQEGLNAGTGEQGNRGTGEQGNTHAQTSGSSEFDSFWSAYPRKVGKQKARTKFTTAVKRAGGAQPIIDGAQRLADDPNLPDKNYIPHPTTWLERDGWDDEPLPPRNGLRVVDAVDNSIEAWLGNPVPDFVEAEIVERREIGR